MDCSIFERLSMADKYQVILYLHHKQQRNLILVLILILISKNSQNIQYMLSFTFEPQQYLTTTYSSPNTEPSQSLLSRLFMLSIQNTRLNHQLEIQSSYPSESFRQDINSISELRVEVNFYRSKYEEEVENNKRVHRVQCQIMANRNKIQNQEEKYQKLSTQYNIMAQEYTNLKQRHESLIHQHNQTLHINQTVQHQQHVIQQLQVQLLQKQQQTQSLHQKLAQFTPNQTKLNQIQQKNNFLLSQLSHLNNQLLYYKNQSSKWEQQLYHCQDRLKQYQQNQVVQIGEVQGYMDRIRMYEVRIGELEEQIRRGQGEIKKTQDTWGKQLSLLSSKIAKVEGERDNAIQQWHTIINEMQKQKNILNTIQTELEQYRTQRHHPYHEQPHNQLQCIPYTHEHVVTQPTSQIRQQSKIKQFPRYSEHSDNHKLTEISDKDHQIDRNRINMVISREVYGFQDMKKNDKDVCHFGRSVSLHNRSRQERQREREISPSYSRTNGMAESMVNRQYSMQLHQNPTKNRQKIKVNRNHSEHKNYNYHSDYNEHETSSNKSHHNYTHQRQPNPPQNQLKFYDAPPGSDSKTLLLEKLNILKPQQTNSSATKANPTPFINKPLPKTLTQMNNKLYKNQVYCQGGKIINGRNSKINGNVSNRNQNHKLQLNPSRKANHVQEKENLNDMIVRRYQNLVRNS